MIGIDPIQCDFNIIAIEGVNDVFAVLNDLNFFMIKYRTLKPQFVTEFKIFDDVAADLPPLRPFRSSSPTSPYCISSPSTPKVPADYVTPSATPKILIDRVSDESISFPISRVIYTF